MSRSMEDEIRMTALIVDDEPIARKVLREDLVALGEVEVIGEADNGSSGLAMILSLKPDIVFLDLQMPEMPGLEVVRRINHGSHLPAVIIITAYDQYAIQALDAGALDYLLKPIGPDRLRAALDRVRRFVGDQLEIAERLVKLQEIQLGHQPPRSRKIVGRDGEEFVFLNVEEILAFQSEGNLVWILTVKSKFLATLSLRAIQERLKDSNFRRIHRNVLVNVEHVRKMSPITSQRWMLTLVNNMEFIVSKRSARNIRDLLIW